MKRRALCASSDRVILGRRRVTSVRTLLLRKHFRDGCQVIEAHGDSIMDKKSRKKKEKLRQTNLSQCLDPSCDYLFRGK